MNDETIKKQESSKHPEFEQKDLSATAILSFTGTGIAWIALRCELCGIARVLLDGSLVATIDTFASTRDTEIVFSQRDLAAQGHTLVIEVTGTASPSSGDVFVVVDAFHVTN